MDLRSCSKPASVQNGYHQYEGLLLIHVPWLQGFKMAAINTGNGYYNNSRFSTVTSPVPAVDIIILQNRT
jgi:hypothetical protein